MRKIIDSHEWSKALMRPSRHGGPARVGNETKVPELGELCPSTTFMKMMFPEGAVPSGHWPMNPSVCAHEGKLWATVRCVSYSLPHGKVGHRSRNLFCGLTGDLEVVTAMEMMDLDPAERVSAPSYGYEDLRLFSLGDGLGASATVLDRAPGKVEMALLELSPAREIVRAQVQRTAAPIEKNWMPIPPHAGKDVRWVYSVDPTIVKTVGHLVPELVWPSPWSLSEVRGGSPLLPLLGGHLAVVHETVSVRRGYGRAYLHRFLTFDEDLRVVLASEPFSFRGHDFEFCAGLARHPTRSKRLVLSFGVEDREAWLAEVDEAEVLKLLP